MHKRFNPTKINNLILLLQIHHARSLPLTTGGQEPNTYVKAYLTPDRSKQTKRKTKVIKKSCFPSFMETLEYRMPIQAIRLKTLQITVWGHDTLQENEFLGGIELPLVNQGKILDNGNLLKRY